MKSALPSHQPVSMYVTRTKGKTIVNQRGVDHDILLGSIQQVAQVIQVAMAAPNSVPRAVLVNNENLAGAEPALRKTHSGVAE